MCDIADTTIDPKMLNLHGAHRDARAREILRDACFVNIAVDVCNAHQVILGTSKQTGDQFVTKVLADALFAKVSNVAGHKAMITRIMRDIAVERINHPQAYHESMQKRTGTNSNVLNPRAARDAPRVSIAPPFIARFVAEGKPVTITRNALRAHIAEAQFAATAAKPPRTATTVAAVATH